MRKLATLVLLLCLASCFGCKLYDTVFDFFGDAYSGGGTTLQEKRDDYNRRVDSYK